MTIALKGKYYHYEFEYKKRRYRGSTEQVERDDAELVEAEIKKRLRLETWGIAPADRTRTPTFTRWAEVFYRDQRGRVDRADFVFGCLTTLLEFWGAKPTRPRKLAAVTRQVQGTRPYHDLRLLDPVLDAEWILRFEEWMTRRGLSGTRKNHLRSTLSMMFKLAMAPTWRKRTRIASNPFQGIRRDRVRVRDRVLSTKEIRACMMAAPFHLRVAMTLAVLAPKLRVGNILALNFVKHVAADLSRITVAHHKARRHSAPLVVPVTPGSTLYRLLEALKHVNRRSGHLIEFNGKKVKSMTSAIRSTVHAAGLTYGARVDEGVTFHTIRHSIATLLATFPGLSEKLRSEIMGQTMQTTQKYTHLIAEAQLAGHAQLSAAVPLGDLIGLGGEWRGPTDLKLPNLAHIRAIPKRMKRGPRTANRKKR